MDGKSRKVSIKYVEKKMTYGRHGDAAVCHFSRLY